MKTPFTHSRLRLYAFAFVLATGVAGCAGSGTSQTTPPVSISAGSAVASADAGAAAVLPADQVAGASVSNVRIHLLKTSSQQRTHAVNHLFDVTNHGGKVIKTAVQHSIFVNCPKADSCWGSPLSFMHDLAASSLIHLLDQYVGTSANGRYGVGSSVSVTDRKDFQLNNVLSENEAFAILHAAVVKLKIKNPGYGHLFHIFLPKGVDECLTAGPCYSPDRPNAFAFCAYHGSVDFKDVGHVIFTMQPYQFVQGCYLAPPYPNSGVADSNDSALSHETFEAITDPDIQTWYSDLLGYEIADYCIDTPFQIDQNLNGHTYKVQQEYSNADHGCAP